ncbi:hypothetical protein MKX01_000086 [Papaver californicum]|nr:hypothetical protein MKX01_000086 [Papaver californicum]
MPLYAKGGLDRMQLQGALSYSVFDHCVRLGEVFQQSGVEESLFRDALLRLSDGQSTLQDWQLFYTRDYPMLTVEEKNNFKHAFRLFPTKFVAASYNHECLKDLGNPVARVVSKNNCETTKIANSDEAKGLQEVLLLSKGSRVMLRKNIYTQQVWLMAQQEDYGYYICKQGEITYRFAVMVDFDKYIGSKLYP